MAGRISTRQYENRAYRPAGLLKGLLLVAGMVFLAAEVVDFASDGGVPGATRQAAVESRVAGAREMLADIYRRGAGSPRNSLTSI